MCISILVAFSEEMLSLFTLHHLSESGLCSHFSVFAFVNTPSDVCIKHNPGFSNHFRIRKSWFNLNTHLIK